MRGKWVCRICGTENAAHYRNRRVCSVCFIKRSSDYHKKNGEKHYEAVRKWRLKNPKRVLEWNLRYLYDFTDSEIEKILNWKSGLCAVCGKELVGLGRLKNNAVVDHDHVNGRFRDFICNSCNCALGFIKDSAGIARKLIVYLERF
jgi:hypothetical protein